MVSACAYSGAYVTGYGLYRPNSDGQPDRWFEEYTASGFTHFQQSGTGAIETYYNYLRVTPLVGGLDQVGYRWPLVDERASPGTYSAGLRGTGVRAELTVSPKGAFHRYTFPESQSAQIAIDVTTGGILSDRRDRGTRPESLDVEVLSKRAACGKVVMEGIPICFHIELDGEADAAGVWSGGVEVPGKQLAIGSRRGPGIFRSFGIFFRKATRAGEQVQVRIGFSLRSVSRARENMQDLTAVSFPEAAGRARAAWGEYLGRIRVQGGTRASKEVFHTALYHSLVKPTDCSDESPYWQEDGPFFSDLATLWDMYKTQLPLLVTLFPDRGASLVNALLTTAEKDGVWRTGYVMNEDNTRFENQARGLQHVVVADAFAKGVEGVDWRRAREAMARTLFLGDRGESFLKQGFTHPFTHTLDLAYGAFCTAQVALGTGDREMYERMMALSANWRNVYDPQTGMLGESRYYEGVAWNYSFRLFHDQAPRIAMCGGDAGFVEVMDRFFGYGAPAFEQLKNRPYGDRMAAGFSLNRFEGLNNESDMETPYTYIYAGRPDRTAEVVQAVMAYQYTTGRGGLPGNDDSGGLSSWYVWSAMGLFPVAGQDLYLIGSPVFDACELDVGGGFSVDVDSRSEREIYVQEAWLDDTPIGRAYLRHHELVDCRRLRLRMGPEPSTWATAERPPSHSGPETDA